MRLYFSLFNKFGWWIRIGKLLIGYRNGQAPQLFSERNRFGYLARFPLGGGRRIVIRWGE